MPYHSHKIGDVLGLTEDQQRQDADLTDFKQFVGDNFVTAGYGGIRLSTPDPTFPDLGAGWVTLVADIPAIDPPRGITYDLVANTIAFSVEGVWLINAGFTIQHDSSNQGRTFNIRMWDVTDGDALAQTPIGIGRNVEVTGFSSALLVNIDATDVNHPIRLEIGGGDSVTVDSLDSYNFIVNYVSNFQGIIP